MDRPLIKIGFADFEAGAYLEYYKAFFVKEIEKFADVQISNEPDFLLCSVSGSEYLNYNCVKILFNTEENEPDFNYYDYAIGYNEMNFYDRYLNFPLYARIEYRDRILASLKKHTLTDDYYLSKTKFCNFIYSNGDAEKFREDTFHALNEYKHVDSAGRFLNNMGNVDIAGSRVGANWSETKREFIKPYRFTIAFGNCQKPGCSDEKIYDAWMAGTIPIFWGDNTFSQIFNEKSYIDCTKCKTPQEVVEKVREIDESPEKYLAMQKEPIALEGSILFEKLENDNLVSDFLKNIMLQSPQDAKRTTNGLFNKIRRKDLLLLAKIKKSLPYKVAKKIKRGLFKFGLSKTNW